MGGSVQRRVINAGLRRVLTSYTGSGRGYTAAASTVPAAALIDTRMLLHGLLAPGRQTEQELQAAHALIDLAKVCFSNKTVLSDFTMLLSSSLLTLHSFDSLYWILTRVADPVQAAWITHDRTRAETVNVDFYY